MTSPRTSATSEEAGKGELLEASVPKLLAEALAVRNTWVLWVKTPSTTKVGEDWEESCVDVAAKHGAIKIH